MLPTGIYSHSALQTKILANIKKKQKQTVAYIQNALCNLQEFCCLNCASQNLSISLGLVVLNVDGSNQALQVI
jgi:hypothetical protein